MSSLGCLLAVGCSNDGDAAAVRTTTTTSAASDEDHLVLCRMRTSRLAVVVLFAFLASGVAACGSDDDRLTASELAEQGNAVCTEADKKFEAAFSEFDEDEEPTAEEMQGLAATAAEITDDVVGQFEDLDPPEDLETSWDDTLEKARAAQEKLELAGEDPESAQALFSSEEDPFDEVNAGLEKVGITVCSDDDEE